MDADADADYWGKALVFLGLRPGELKSIPETFLECCISVVETFWFNTFFEGMFGNIPRGFHNVLVKRF